MKLKLKKGDTVAIIAGKDKGKKAKILGVFPASLQVTVEGVNMRTKHVKARRQGEKTQSVQVPVPLHISNVQIVCGACQKPVRIGYRMEAATKTRICKKCNTEIR